MAIAMHGHGGIKIEPLDFAGRCLPVGFEDDEAASLSGVAGDGTKILATDCYAHDDLLIGKGWKRRASKLRAGAARGEIRTVVLFRESVMTSLPCALQCKAHAILAVKNVTA
jgi:hypothetical protein